MAINSKDIETLWKRYTNEGFKGGVSVCQFFESNGVPYHVFQKWYKKNFQEPSVADCLVEGTPAVTGKSNVCPPPSKETGVAVINNVVIYLSNGMKIEHRRLSYPDLLDFIQKLQPLCSA